MNNQTQFTWWSYMMSVMTKYKKKIAAQLLWCKEASLKQSDRTISMYQKAFLTFLRSGEILWVRLFIRVELTAKKYNNSKIIDVHRLEWNIFSWHRKVRKCRQ